MLDNDGNFYPKFVIGDRVAIAMDHPDGNPDLVRGVLGTITEVPDMEGDWYSVDYDIEFEGGHDCGGVSRDGHGWRTPEKYLDFAAMEAEDEISAESCQSVIDFLCT
jgi:hypothetical protein